MNKKEISEIKKTYTPQKCAITRIAMCYVDAEKNKIASNAESFLPLPEEEIFKYFEIFRKTLSGSIGRTALNMEFPLSTEMEGGTQAFLYALLESELKDDDLLDQFYDKVIDSYVYGENYLILLAYSVYDVPGRTKDNIEMEDASEEVYSFINAAICPVDLSKPGLSFDAKDAAFHNRIRDWVVGMPDLGFLFPAFNDRSSDIHSLLYYSRDAENMHFDLTDKLLGCELPLTAGGQKEAFEAVVEETLGDSCDFDTVKALHDSIREMQENAKDSPDPVEITRTDMKNLLSEAGAQTLEAFDASYDKNAGEDETFMASNIAPARKFEVRTPDVVISVSPDRSDLVEQRIVDGRPCLVIPITDEIQVNGIHVKPMKVGGGKD